MNVRRRKVPGTGSTEGSSPAAVSEGGGSSSSPFPETATPVVGEPSGERFPLPVAWGNVISDTLRIPDPAGLAKRLRDELSLGEERTAYGQILWALDRSARNFDDATRLYRRAKVEFETYSKEVQERIEVLRAAALRELMEEYKLKKRPSPTKGDIEDRVLANWGTEYRDLSGKLTQFEEATKSLEGLRDAWASRCADLREMSAKARPVT